MKEKEIFINKTKCSKKEYNMFIKSHAKQYGLKEDLYTIIYAILFLWFMIYSVMNGIYLAAIILIIVLIVFLTYRIISPNLTIRKELKSKKIKNEEENTYNFYKHHFKVKNKQGEPNILYLKIKKVLETDTHFYIYLTKNSAYVVAKKGFIKGNSEEFSQFLRKRVLFRYKNKKTNS